MNSFQNQEISCSGRAGLNDLISRLVHWRVPVRRYAVVLLTSPFLLAAIFLSLSLSSPRFIPPVITSGNRIPLLLTASSAGLAGAFFEELGWTGFAVPALRIRHGILATGLISGVLWGAWHLLVNMWYGSSICGDIPLKMFLTLYFITGVAQLTAYRILMVWVYDRTGSLLLAILMHSSLIMSTTPMLIPVLTGADFLSWSAASAILMWGAVAVVSFKKRGSISLPITGRI